MTAWIIAIYVFGAILMTMLAYKGEERGLKLIAFGLFWPFIILYSLFDVND